MPLAAARKQRVILDGLGVRQEGRQRNYVSGERRRVNAADIEIV